MFQFIKNFFAKLFGKKTQTKIEESLAGWIPDVADDRDLVYKDDEDVKTKTILPPSVDLTSRFGPVESQGLLNSCVGHAVTSVFEMLTGVSDRSRLFSYYNARYFEGRTGSDSGCQIRNGMKGLSVYGAATETLWPYSSSNVLVKPTTAAFDDGLKFRPRIASYARVLDFTSMKTALSRGRPVVFGFSVPSTFRTQTAFNGILPFPAAGTTYIGGHAVVAVGYDDTTGMVKCRNSFGPNWGSNGYFFMPYQWFANMSGLVSDAWIMNPAA